jgi:hypothetical protein
MKSLAYLFIPAVMLVLTGCASIVSDSLYPVTVTSSPDGAALIVKDKAGRILQKTVTPATVMLPASVGFFNPATYTFQFEKAGYYPAITSLTAGLDGWYIMNVLSGGFIGLVVIDPATGAMWKLGNQALGTLTPNPDYDPDTLPLPAQKETLETRLKALDRLFKSGTLTEREYQAKRKSLIQDL